MCLLCTLGTISGGTEGDTKTDTRKALLKKNVKPKKFDPNSDKSVALLKTTTTSTTMETTTSTTETPEPEPEPMNDRVRLKKMLLQNYDKKIHPVKDWTKPVKVKLRRAIIREIANQVSQMGFLGWDIHCDLTDKYYSS